MKRLMNRRLSSRNLVDSDDVEGVDSHTEMEGFFTKVLGHVFVGANSSGLKSLGRKLFQLVGDHDDVVREVKDRSLF